MGLKETALKAVDKGIAALRNLVYTGTYTSVVISAYNATTDVNTEVTTEYADIPIVMTSFRVEELEQIITKKAEVKVIISSTHVPVMPTENDRFVVDGKTWRVAVILSPPKSLVWILGAKSLKTDD